MTDFTPPHTSPPPTNTLAIVSLAAGVLSWVFFPIIGAIVGVVTGHMARSEIKASLGAQSGDGLAIVGLVLSYLNLVTTCLSFLLVVLFFGGMFGLSACAILSESAQLMAPDSLLSLLAN
ncbi:MAG: DUF4190 domain-containing protein [Anaerolineae bacterium]|nr:DUF4190 domain-containing protein [Anaerolineae bacterium]